MASDFGAQGLGEGLLHVLLLVLWLCDLHRLRAWSKERCWFVRLGSLGFRFRV